MPHAKCKASSGVRSVRLQGSSHCQNSKFTIQLTTSVLQVTHILSAAAAAEILACKSASAAAASAYASNKQANLAKKTYVMGVLSI